MAAVLVPSTQEFKEVRTSFNVDISHVSAYIPCIMGLTTLYVSLNIGYTSTCFWRLHVWCRQWRHDTISGQSIVRGRFSEEWTLLFFKEYPALCYKSGSDIGMCSKVFEAQTTYQIHAQLFTCKVMNIYQQYSKISV